MAKKTELIQQFEELEAYKTNKRVPIHKPCESLPLAFTIREDQSYQLNDIDFTNTTYVYKLITNLGNSFVYDSKYTDSEHFQHLVHGLKISTVHFIYKEIKDELYKLYPLIAEAYIDDYNTRERIMSKIKDIIDMVDYR